jgi:flagellar M-ring protein FliF
VLDQLKTLGIARLASLGAVGFAMLGLLAVIALRGPSASMTPIYTELDPREASQMADLLDHQKIPYQVSPAGTQISVAEPDVPRARMLLAKEGLPSGGSLGYELLDRTDSITASPYQQEINQARALEGELARTIRGIRGVKAVRVHLVLPKREPFSRTRQESQASIQLTMTGAARLDRDGVNAIISLVSAAVPGLKPGRVAITDTRGNLLSRPDDTDGASPLIRSLDEARIAAESRLSHAVEDMLDLSLGAGHAHAAAAITFNYDQIRETQERFDPENQVPRSVQTVTSSSKSTESTGTVSVQNNLPNADAGATPSGSTETHQDETTNYEIAKSVRTVVHEQPRVERLSLAVMVDGVTETKADGTTEWHERSPEELAKINRLVKAAMGFDEKRGDKVEVLSLRFAPEQDEPADAKQALLAGAIQGLDISRIIQAGLACLLGLAGLLLVVRPMLRQYSQIALAGGSTTASLSGTIGADGVLTPIGDQPALLGAPAETVMGLLPDGRPREDENMLQIAQIDGQLRASSIRRIAELVERHPDQSLAILRNWMHEEPA